MKDFIVLTKFLMSMICFTHQIRKTVIKYKYTDRATVNFQVQSTSLFKNMCVDLYDWSLRMIYKAVLRMRRLL